MYNPVRAALAAIGYADAETCSRAELEALATPDVANSISKLIKNVGASIARGVPPLSDDIDALADLRARLDLQLDLIETLSREARRLRVVPRDLAE